MSQVAEWSQGQVKPGQFTGHKVIIPIPKHEHDRGLQAWAKKVIVIIIIIIINYDNYVEYVQKSHSCNEWFWNETDDENGMGIW